MQAQRNAATTNRYSTPTATRREVRHNVNQWREQAMEQRIRTLPLPVRQPEPEIVRPWVQNLVIGLVATAAFALAIASWLGVL